MATTCGSRVRFTHRPRFCTLELCVQLGQTQTQVHQRYHILLRMESQTLITVNSLSWFTRVICCANILGNTRVLTGTGNAATTTPVRMCEHARCAYTCQNGEQHGATFPGVCRFEENTFGHFWVQILNLALSFATNSRLRTHTHRHKLAHTTHTIHIQNSCNLRRLLGSHVSGSARALSRRWRPLRVELHLQHARRRHLELAVHRRVDVLVQQHPQLGVLLPQRLRVCDERPSLLQHRAGDRARGA